MPAEVNEESLAILLEFTSGALSRDEAKGLLRISDHNVEQAGNKFWEVDGDPTAIRKLISDANTGWDGSAFATDRYGQYDSSSSIPTFNIDYAPGVDHYPHSGGPSGAPTRPSSRTSHRSVVSTHAGDAPRPSVEDGLELGVIGASQPHFGPATKDESYYDNASWAMVPATKSIEYIPDATIFYQSRNPDTPGFIKPLPNQDYLPALLTILHTIPLFRNALLTPQVAIGNYWSGDEWWKGNASAPARLVDTASGFGPDIELDILHETQRLMAFLDKGERSYASLDSLLQLDAWRDSEIPPGEDTYAMDDLLKFLLKWGWAYQKHTPGAVLDGVFRSTLKVGSVQQESFVLDATVVQQEQSDKRALTLYDVLDQTLFESDTRNAHIVDISNVLILRLTASKDTAKLGCEITATLYADRYLEENRALIDQMFTEGKQYEEQLTKIDIDVEKLKYHTPQTATYAKKMDTLTLLKTSMKAFEPELGGETEDPKHAAVLAQLQTLYESVEIKLKSLEEEKEKVRAALNGVSDRFRAPMDGTAQAEASEGEAPQHKFTHPYKLWGVATSPCDYYVLHPNSKPEDATAQQWWHINYIYSGDDASINREPVDISTVLEKASSDSGKALLVYANDGATSTPPIPLATALEKFVTKDTANLQHEVTASEASWANYQQEDDGTQVTGNWMAAQESSVPPTYSSMPFDDTGFDDWNSMTAKEYHERAAADVDSGMSSTTLTPNTEVDEEGGETVEMQEVNHAVGGPFAGAALARSRASSDTIDGEPMDILSSDGLGTTISMKDVEMLDSEEKDEEEAEVEHTEVVPQTERA